MSSSAGNENKLTGYAALPVNLNPYLAEFGEPVLAAGAVRPLAGAYDVVFDSARRVGRGASRSATGSTTHAPDRDAPAAARVPRHPARRAGERCRLRASIPRLSRVTVDGRTRSASLRAGSMRIPTATLTRGPHVLRVQASDYQESRNMENVPPILPNTRVLSVKVVVR